MLARQLGDDIPERQGVLEQHPAEIGEIAEGDGLAGEQGMVLADHQHEMILEDQPGLEIGPLRPLVQHREEQIEVAAMQLDQQLGERAAADAELERRALAGHPGDAPGE